VMSKDFHHRRMIEFVDTDMAGIVHFSNYFKYMELTEYVLFRHENLDMMHHRDGGKLAWPRVHVECDYRKPLILNSGVCRMTSPENSWQKAVPSSFARRWMRGVT